MAFLGGLVVKNLPAIQDTLVQSLGWDDPLEEGMATHTSMLARRIPWAEEPSVLQSTVAQIQTWLKQLTKNMHYSVQSLSRVQLFAIPWTTARQASLSITNFRSLL